MVLWDAICRDRLEHMVRGIMRITAVHRPARMVSMGFGLAFMFVILLVVGIYRSVEGINGDGGFQELVFSKENNNTPTAFARKLLAMADDDDHGDGDDNAGNTMNRIGGTCSKDNIVVFQGPTSPLPNGIPTYTVQILNVCVSGCSVSDIHLSCGWFSSARLINPRIFRRVYFNDCLVNNGEPLSPGESLSFQYANSFSYPLSVSSIAC